MKLIDKTPYRNEKGIIDFLGRIQGSFRFGQNWGRRLAAQDSILGILEKSLDSRFYLLRNIFLPGTDIELPLVLIGPPGIYLLNVVYERGVYRVHQDEWGTLSGDRFIPARMNQVQRCVKLARVISIFFERNEISNVPVVEPVLIASDPAMHIESVEPAARIVMIDALERFAISMNQAPVLLNLNKIAEVARKLVSDFEIIPPSTPAFISSDFSELKPGEILDDESPIMGEQPFIIPQFNPEQPEHSEIIETFPPNAPDKPESIPAAPPVLQQAEKVNQPGPVPFKVEQADPFENLRSSAADDLSFPDFDAEPGPIETVLGETEQEPAEQTLRDTVTRSANNIPAKRTRLFGMTTVQILILGGLFLFWLAAMAAFAVYIFFFAR